MTTSFRASAEARLAELDAEERERNVRREERAERARTEQAADAAHRASVQRAEAEQANAATRQRLVDTFGAAAAKLNPDTELYVFLIPHRGVAVCHTRVPAAPNKALIAAGPANPSWALQQRLQSALNTGVNAPTILRAGQLPDHASGLALLVDPSVGTLHDWAGWWGGA